MRTLTYRFFLISGVLCLFLASCQSDEQVKVNYNVLSEPLLDSLKLEQHLLGEQLVSMYENLGGEKLWIRNHHFVKHTDLLFDMLQYPTSYGLDSTLIKPLNLTLYHADSIPVEKQDSLEISLSEHYLLLLHILGVEYTDTTLVIDNNIPQKLKDLKSAQQYIEQLSQLFSINPQAHILQNSLKEFLGEFKVYDQKVEIMNEKLDKSLSHLMAKKALILRGYDSLALQKESFFRQAIKSVQESHGLIVDGRIGNNTARALSMTGKQRLSQMLENLWKYRFSEAFIKEGAYINVPSYLLRLRREDTIQREHRIIVGNPKAPTPSFKDTIQYLVVYPYWNIPSGIAVKEIVPKIIQDSTYMARNNYELLTWSKEPVNPKNVKLTGYTAEKFPYRIRQKGGKGNALGLIKFMFPNPYYVYLHDTPGKKLFKNEIRTYSHGCIRLENPLDLASTLLENDQHEFNLDSIQGYINKEERKVVKLNKPIPIQIQYFTLELNEKKQLILFPDVYDQFKKNTIELFEWQRELYQILTQKKSRV